MQKVVQLLKATQKRAGFYLSEGTWQQSVLVFQSPHKAVGWALRFQKELLKLASSCSKRVEMLYLQSLDPTFTGPVSDPEGRIVFESVLARVGLHTGYADRVYRQQNSKAIVYRGTVYQTAAILASWTSDGQVWTPLLTCNNTPISLTDAASLHPSLHQYLVSTRDCRLQPVALYMQSHGAAYSVTTLVGLGTCTPPSRGPVDPINRNLYWSWQNLRSVASPKLS